MDSRLNPAVSDSRPPRHDDPLSAQAAPPVSPLSTLRPLHWSVANTPARRSLGTTPRRRVLIVDDSLQAAQTLAGILEVDGHDTCIAQDGLEALQALDSFAPDAVFLDIGLPYLDGYETCRHLRSRPGGERLLIVALTGWNLPRDQQRALLAGFDHHVAKPYDVDRLYRILAEAQ